MNGIYRCDGGPFSRAGAANGQHVIHVHNGHA